MSVEVRLRDWRLMEGACGNGMEFSPTSGWPVGTWGSSLIATRREVVCRDDTTLGVETPGKFEEFLRVMSGARLRRVCHEANILESQVGAGVDQDSRNDRNNECGGEQLGDYV
jgi:hypothetical protein